MWQLWRIFMASSKSECLDTSNLDFNLSFAQSLRGIPVDKVLELWTANIVLTFSSKVFWTLFADNLKYWKNSSSAVNILSLNVALFIYFFSNRLTRGSNVSIVHDHCIFSRSSKKSFSTFLSIAPIVFILGVIFRWTWLQHINLVACVQSGWEHFPKTSSPAFVIAGAPSPIR